MAQGNLKGVGGGASGILSGVAAVATVVAAIMGILSQFGLITSRHPQDGGGYFDTGTTAGHQSDRGAGRGGAHGESVARRAAAPHFHERRSRAKSPPVEIASSARPAAPPPEVVLAEPTPSHLGAEDRNFPHLETPGAANTPATVDHNRSEGIAGAWRDQGMGACHLISQTGSKFQITNCDPATGEVISQGEGTVDGNHVEIDYPNSRRPVTVDLHVSPNGQWMLGKVTRFDGTRRCGDISDRLVRIQADPGRRVAPNPAVPFRFTFVRLAPDCA